MTSRTIHFLSLASLILILPACQTTPPPRPVEPSSTAVIKLAPLPRLDGPGKLTKGTPLPSPERMLAYLDGELEKIGFPEKPDPSDKNIYFNYHGTDRATWAKDGWLSELDFSGVSQNFYTAGTLIHPQYIVLSTHLPKSQGSAYSKTVFHDRQTGDYVEREVIDHRDITYTVKHKYDPGKTFDFKSDVRLCKLDAPVPPGVRHYPMLPSGIAYREILRGARLLVLDYEKKVHIMEIDDIGLDESENITLSARQPQRTDLDWWEKLIRGDSGHPSFLYYEGNLVLIETHSSTGREGKGTAGPFYGNARIQQGIAEAFLEMEN